MFTGDSGFLDYAGDHERAARFISSVYMCVCVCARVLTCIHICTHEASLMKTVKL